MSVKDTKGKLPLNLIPPRAIEQIALVRGFGNKKYGSPWAWRESGNPLDFIEATKRHLLEIDKDGDLNVLDRESHLLHLSHALCSLAMAVELTVLQRDKIMEAIDKHTEDIYSDQLDTVYRNLTDTKEV